MTIHELKKALAAALSLALAVPAGVVPAAAAEAAAVTAEFQGLEVADDLVAIKLSTAVLYNSFLTQKPPRLVIELLDTRHALPSQSAKGRGILLAGVRSSQFERIPRMVTRVVMDLVKLAGYKVSTDARGLTVQLVGSVDDSPAVPASGSVSSAPASVPARPVVAKRAVRAAVPKPQSTVEPEFPEPAAEPAPAMAAPAPAEPERLGPPKPKANAMQAMQRAGLARTMTHELAAAAHDSDISKRKPPTGEEVETDGRGRRTGRYRDIMTHLPRDPVTLDFDNTDVRDVIRLLAAKAKVNLVFGPDVSGTLTLHLGNAPFQEAFRTVLSMMKLTTDQVGDNILRVITPAELTKQRTTSSAITRVFTLNYAKAVEVKATIDSVRTAEGRTGSSIGDAKSNQIIVTDTLEGLLSTENLIFQLDQRPRQVLIEAKLVEVNLNNQLNYGVNWDYLGSQQGRIGRQQGTTLIGTTSNPPQASSISKVPLDANGFLSVANVIASPGAGGRGTGVALNADRVFGALTLGRITNNFALTATLTAAASEGKAKVLSEPKIATLNNQAASINVTTQIPYVTSNVASTGVQTQTVNYITTGIQLTVTPSINEDGRITLQVNPNVSQPSATASGSTATGAPAIDSRIANTTVLVRDGETIVIGGLISDTLQDTISKIPFLGDIPILGWLFKKKTKQRIRAELLIFVTTRIMPD